MIRPLLIFIIALLLPSLTWNPEPGASSGPRLGAPRAEALPVQGGIARRPVPELADVAAGRRPHMATKVREERTEAAGASPVLSSEPFASQLSASTTTGALENTEARGKRPIRDGVCGLDEI